MSTERAFALSTVVVRLLGLADRRGPTDFRHDALVVPGLLSIVVIGAGAAVLAHFGWVSERALSDGDQGQTPVMRFDDETTVTPA